MVADGPGGPSGAAGARRAAIVAFHARCQPAELSAFVEAVQRELLTALGPGFAPRPVLQVHSTVIGLDSPGLDPAVLVRHLVDSLRAAPLTLQLGGFEDRDYGLRSREQRLFDRSLTVDNGQVVLVGWPVSADQPDPALDRLRREAAELGFCHRYPLSDGASDPDAHLVIGEVGGGLVDGALVDGALVDGALVDGALAELRRWLVDRPCRVALTPERLSVVVYDDASLPEGSTVVVPLAEAATVARALDDAG